MGLSDPSKPHYSSGRPFGNFRLLSRNELAHHYQGQSPKYVLVGFTFVISPQNFLTLTETLIYHNDVKTRAVALFQKNLSKSCNETRIGFRSEKMSSFAHDYIQRLDLIFPFVVLGYGALVTIVLNSTSLIERAEQAFPDSVVQQLKSNRLLAQICVVIGFFWSLQTLCF